MVRLGRDVLSRHNDLPYTKSGHLQCLLCHPAVVGLCTRTFTKHESDHNNAININVKSNNAAVMMNETHTSLYDGLL